MSLDARILTALPSHPKTKKLIRRVGEAGAWHLICLFLWARANRPDGCLAGMTIEDIELAVDWRGDPDAFVHALLAVGFLEGAEGEFIIHDWAEHNPYAYGSEMRSLKARWNAIKGHHGETEADRLVPEWAAIRHRDASSTEKPASSTASSKLVAPKQDAPLPLPLPSPYPKKQDQELLPTASPIGDPDPTQKAHPIPPADLAVRRAERIAKITEDAIAAFNSILGKPVGKLRAVKASVGRKNRQSQVQRSAQTASEICQDQYGDKRITPEFWESYFGACADDPFTSGEGPYTGQHANWMPDFEYLTRPATMVKVFDRATDEAASG